MRMHAGWTVWLERKILGRLEGEKVRVLKGPSRNGKLRASLGSGWLLPRLSVL